MAPVPMVTGAQAAQPERLPTARGVAALRRQQTATRRSNEDTQDRQRERRRSADGER